MNPGWQLPGMGKPRRSMCTPPQPYYQIITSHKFQSNCWCPRRVGEMNIIIFRNINLWLSVYNYKTQVNVQLILKHQKWSWELANHEKPKCPLMVVCYHIRLIPGLFQKAPGSTTHPRNQSLWQTLLGSQVLPGTVLTWSTGSSRGDMRSLLSSCF